MKIPVNFLLYTASLGMLAQAGWLFYQATPNLGAEPLQTFITRGLEEAQEIVQRGMGSGREDRRYPYHRQEWWNQFKDFNCVGKLPPPPDEPKGPQVEQPATQAADTPIGEIVELLWVMYDTATDPEESETMVAVRYLPEANVAVPEEFRPKSPGPADSLPLRPAPARGGTPAPTSSLPTFGTREAIHFIRVGESLWPDYEHIKLARVHEDAESAYFVRTRPGDPPDAEPEEEQLFKAALQLDQEVLAALAQEHRGQRARAAQEQSAPTGPNVNWVDVEETKMVNGQYHVSRKDQQMFRENSDQLLQSVNLVEYEPRFGDRSLRGLRVANVDPALSSRFGVQQGDVILALNGVPVRTRSQAISEGKKQYNRGVRTFVVKMMSGGQIIERVYQAPEN